MAEHNETGADISRRLGRIAILTGGADKPYALGLASSLIQRGLTLDFIGSNEVSSPELLRSSQVKFFNLRGDQSPNVSFSAKCLRLLSYYARLIRYAASAEPKIFHILWNNKIEVVDRLLLVYYKLLGKKILFTAHNVNIRKRDGHDSWLNTISLKFQYRIVDGIFVHTDKMREELINEFHASAEKITVIPFGINTAFPNTEITPAEARQRLGIGQDRKVLLFFGNIAPYKGLEYLVESLAILVGLDSSYYLVIAGKPKNCPEYWARIKKAIDHKDFQQYIYLDGDFIPDDRVELYFKAADVLILPYTHIFQSGVLLTSYYFGLPVIASDVGSLREDVVEGKTGFIFKPRDSISLASTIVTHFHTEMYFRPEPTRAWIMQYANERYSWLKVGELTCSAYSAVGPRYSGTVEKSIRRVLNERK